MNTNRREFIKTASGTLALAGLGTKIATGKPVEENPVGFYNFSQFFDKVNIDNPNRGYLDLPLSFVQKNTIPAYTSSTKIPDRRLEDDIIRVHAYNRTGKTQSEVEAAFDRDCINTILAAGTDRGIMVYDNKTPSGKWNESLIQLMRRCSKENSRYPQIKPNVITDIIIRKQKDVNRKTTFDFITGEIIEFHNVNDSDFDHIEKYFLNELQGYLPKPNLMIAICRSKFDFVMPISDPKFYKKDGLWNSDRGIAVMDNTKILLGSY